MIKARHIISFFEKNLFERIIIYLFVASLTSKFFFELILGQHGFTQAQNKQWIFFGLLALDYVCSFKKIFKIKFTLNLNAIFALLLLLIIVHGTFIGFMAKNRIFALITDIIPLLMIALNILRMQSYAECSKPIDIESLFKIVTALSLFTVLFGFIAVSLGKPSVVDIPWSPIYVPLICTILVHKRPIPIFWLGLSLIIVGLSIGEINRTTMLFISAITIASVLILSIKQTGKAIACLMVLILIVSCFWISLPENSKTRQRIEGIAHLDLSARTGSIGERQAEFDSIKATIKERGIIHQWAGLGFGALYEFQSTHSYVKNHGHVHYAWAWFYLRFGYIGYLYLAIMAMTLLYNCINGLKTGTTTSIFSAFLCIQGTFYLATYVNALFLTSGIHFLHVNNTDSKNTTTKQKTQNNSSLGDKAIHDPFLT